MAVRPRWAVVAILSVALLVSILWVARGREAEDPRTGMSPPQNLAEPDSSLIVNNPAPDPERPALRVSPAPVMSAGVVKGDTTTELWRVMDANEVRVMDAAGNLVRRVGIGRPGAGPEDIQWATQLSAAEGDSFRVLDQRLGRITTFDTAAKSIAVLPTVRFSSAPWTGVAT